MRSPRHSWPVRPGANEIARALHDWWCANLGRPMRRVPLRAALHLP
ncbi:MULTISPECIES: hypothetical protein [Deinococcus]|nr:hypothetical protein [Deinococcus indicus]